MVDSDNNCLMALFQDNTWRTPTPEMIKSSYSIPSTLFFFQNSRDFRMVVTAVWQPVWWVSQETKQNEKSARRDTNTARWL